MTATARRKLRRGHAMEPPRRTPCPSAPRPTTSRPSRRCSAPSSSTTRRTTASRASSSRTTSTIRCTSRSTRRPSKLIASGKQATPITLRTFFENAEPIDATLTVPQYLGRLAANATTIINARDYGRTIHDLATRRQLILIGEDMVNAAYDSPGRLPAQGADRGGRDAAVLAGRDRQVRPGLPRLQHAR